MNKTSNIHLRCIPLLILLLNPAATLADAMNTEIDYLISSVGIGGCTLIRNGKSLTSRDARAHLKSKRKRNAHLIDSTEEFIEKIASQSATSGKPYLIRCKHQHQTNAREWFTARLAQLREPSST